MSGGLKYRRGRPQGNSARKLAWAIACAPSVFMVAYVAVAVLNHVCFGV